MSSTRWTLFTIAWFLVISGASAQETRAPDPLFQSADILDVRIVAPMSTLLSKRPFDEELPATFQFTNSAGEAVEFDMKIRTRGRFRREWDICRFPPMRLNFKTSQTKGTLFHKQDKLKLVTHCQSSNKYADVLLREYTAYRILNVMTNISFNVRLMRITYVDNDGKKKDDTRYGFVIEHRDRLAKRLNKSVLEIEHTSSKALDAPYANLISVYHYLIGNTDFSAIRGSSGETCCHNHVLFGNDNEPVWSVPYDFDQAGLVDAPHAGPNPAFSIQSVRQRLYRGRCMNNDILDTTVRKFNDKRGEILEIVTEAEAAKSRSSKMMASYIEKFYKLVGSEKRLNSQIVKKCI